MMAGKPEQDFHIYLEEPEKIHSAMELKFRITSLPLEMLVEDFKGGRLRNNYPMPRNHSRVKLGRVELLQPNLFLELEAFISLDNFGETYKPNFFAYYKSLPKANWDQEMLEEFENSLVMLYPENSVHHFQRVDDFHIFRIDHPAEEIASYINLGFEDGEKFQVYAEIDQALVESKLENRPRISSVLYPIKASPFKVTNFELGVQKLKFDEPEKFSNKINTWATDMENVLRITALVKKENLEGTFTLRAPEL